MYPPRSSTSSLSSIPEEFITTHGLILGTPPPKTLLARNTYIPARRIPRCRIRAPILVSQAKHGGEKSREEVIQELVEECKKDPEDWMKGSGVEKSREARQRIGVEEDVLVLLSRERERERYELGEGPSNSRRCVISKNGTRERVERKTNEDGGKDAGKRIWGTCGGCKNKMLGTVCYVCKTNTGTAATCAGSAYVVLGESRSFPLVKKARQSPVCGLAIVVESSSEEASEAPPRATRPSLSRGSINGRRAAPGRFKKPGQARRRETLGMESLDNKEIVPVDTKVAASSDVRDRASLTAQDESNVVEESNGLSENQSGQHEGLGPELRKSKDELHLAPDKTDVTTTVMSHPCDKDASVGQRYDTIHGELRPIDPDRKRNIIRQKFVGLPIKLNGGYFYECLDESAVGEVLKALLESQEAAVRAARERLLSIETTAVATPMIRSLNKIKSLCRKVARRTTVAKGRPSVDLKVKKEVNESNGEEDEPLNLATLSRELTREFSRQSIETAC